MDCGYCAPAGDVENLSKYIRENVIPKQIEFAQKGKNGRTAYERHFAKESCINNLINILKN